MRVRRHATTTHRKVEKRNGANEPVLRVVQGAAVHKNRKPRGGALGVRIRGAVQLAGSARLIAGVTLILLVIGLYMVFSASIMPSLQASGTSWHFFEMQGFFVIIGIGLALLFSAIDYRRWLTPKWTAISLALALSLLVLVALQGTTIGGSKRWLPVGPIMFQPSEVAKLAVVIATSTLMARLTADHATDSRKILTVGIIASPSAFLVVLQPDIGTASIIMAIGFAGLFASGVSHKTLALVGGAVGTVVLMFAFATGYASKRFSGLLNQGSNLQTTNYQLHQSKIAIASGGLTGKGYGGSTLKYGALPNPHTDFIFSILGEEFGLLGTLTVLCLFGLLIWFGMRTALRASELSGSILALTITTLIALQAFINIASVVGLFPVTGVPLPLISYGGTALMVDLTAIGLLISVAKSEEPVRRQRAHSPKGKPRASQRSVRNSRPSSQLVPSGASRPSQGQPRRSR